MRVGSHGGRGPIDITHYRLGLDMLSCIQLGLSPLDVIIAPRLSRRFGSIQRVRCNLLLALGVDCFPKCLLFQCRIAH